MQARGRQTHLAYPLQPLPRTNIPLSVLFDLGEDLGLDQRAARDHHAVDAAPVVLRKEAVTAAEDRDARDYALR